jgi:peptide/nickel transport system permease protein
VRRVRGDRRDLPDMIAFLARRLLTGFATMLLASVVVFCVLEILPGDPALLMLGMNAAPEALATLREQLGLNDPLLIRYFGWIFGLLSGDFGRSFTYSSPVIDLIAERAVVSLPLAVIALALSTAIAIPVGIFTAARRGKPADTITMGAAQIGVAVPNFWFALLLVYVFAVWLRLVPAGGFPGWSAGLWPGLKALILPAVALALPQAAILARVTRSAMLEVLGEDYIRTARAKGMPRRTVLWRHALRNAMIPVLTILGLQFAFLIAGTIIIENVFYLPGLGRLVFQAITQRDLIVVEGVVILLVASVIVVNIVVDICYALVDPRLRSNA